MKKLLWGLLMGAAGIAARTVKVTTRDDSSIAAISPNCGNTVNFSDEMRTANLAFCYHQDGSYLDLCTGEIGTVGPGKIQSVTSLNPQEEKLPVTDLNFGKNEYFKPYSCQKFLKTTKDVTVSLKEPVIMKVSDVAVIPGGKIFNTATKKQIGTLPPGSYETMENPSSAPKVEFKGSATRKSSGVGVPSVKKGSIFATTKASDKQSDTSAPNSYKKARLDL